MDLRNFGYRFFVFVLVNPPPHTLNACHFIFITYWSFKILIFNPVPVEGKAAQVSLEIWSFYLAYHWVNKYIAICGIKVSTFYYLGGWLSTPTNQVKVYTKGTIHRVMNSYIISQIVCFWMYSIVYTQTLKVLSSLWLSQSKNKSIKRRKNMH